MVKIADVFNNTSAKSNQQDISVGVRPDIISYFMAKEILFSGNSHKISSNH